MNHDHSCFAYGTETGFVVYNCDPFTERFSRLTKPTLGSDKGNGLKIVRMLFRSNIFIQVGGFNGPKYPQNMVIVWDDHKQKIIAELEFAGPVINVYVKRDFILVLLEEKAFVYNFSDLKLLHTFDTFSNPSGIGCISTGKNTIIALPDVITGSILTFDILSKSQHNFQAHESGIAHLAISPDGAYVASVSNRGTLVRIWDTVTGVKIKELRRGSDPVIITGLSFDLGGSRICVSSTKGTVHIFSLLKELNIKSKFSVIETYLPNYFSSEWSSITFTIPKNSICEFGSGDILFVITYDNILPVKFSKYVITNNTAKCIETTEMKSGTIPVYDRGMIC